MMGESLAHAWRQELLLLAKAIGQGLGLAVLYETFRVPRRLLRFGRAAEALGDLIFCLVASLVMFGFFLRVSHGRPRIYLLVGMAFGAAFWFCVPGRVLMDVTYRLRRCLLWIWLAMGRIAAGSVKKFHIFVKK